MKKIIITLLLLFSLSTSLCFAQTNPSLKDAFNNVEEISEDAGYQTSQDANLIDTIGGLISFVLSVLGIIFVLLIIYSGFIWMIAGGEEKKVTEAKDTIKQAIIGLVIVLAAYVLSYFIIETFSIFTD